MNKAFQDHKADFFACQEIIERESKTFYAAFSQLPKQDAWSVYAVYAFCRKADDLIDEAKAPLALEQLKKELAVFEKGQTPDNFMWRALRVVFDQYPMDFKPFYDMLKGQEMDAAFVQPQNQEELATYSYYVAGTVGLMLLPIISDDPTNYQEEAKQIGEAMQLTNILRDVGEDKEKGRIYLPRDKMLAYGVDPDFQGLMVTENFISLWEDQAQRAEKLYQSGLSLMKAIKPGARLALLAAIYFYRAILDACRQADYQVFTKRHSVSSLEKAKLLLKVKEDLKQYK
ncbi:phytoene/squalene synthase family protein [Streptococcus cameli]